MSVPPPGAPGARSDENVSASAPMACISACRLTTQKPTPSGVWAVGSWNHTGASCAQQGEGVVGEPVGERRQICQVDVAEAQGHPPAPFVAAPVIRPHRATRHPRSTLDSGVPEGALDLGCDAGVGAAAGHVGAADPVVDGHGTHRHLAPVAATTGPRRAGGARPEPPTGG